MIVAQSILGTGTREAIGQRMYLPPGQPVNMACHYGIAGGYIALGFRTQNILLDLKVRSSPLLTDQVSRGGTWLVTRHIVYLWGKWERVYQTWKILIVDEEEGYIDNVFPASDIS